MIDFTPRGLLALGCAWFVGTVLTFWYATRKERAMSHHFSKPEGDSELVKLIREKTKSLGLGATRAFPNGVINDLDEGEIQFAIGSDKDRQKVFINFGKSVDVIGMTPEQAVGMAQLLIRHARAVTKQPLTVTLH